LREALEFGRSLWLSSSDARSLHVLAVGELLEEDLAVIAGSSSPMQIGVVAWLALLCIKLEGRALGVAASMT